MGACYSFLGSEDRVASRTCPESSQSIHRVNPASPAHAPRSAGFTDACGLASGESLAPASWTRHAKVPITSSLTIASQRRAALTNTDRQPVTSRDDGACPKPRLISGARPAAPGQRASRRRRASRSRTAAWNPARRRPRPPASASDPRSQGLIRSRAEAVCRRRQEHSRRPLRCDAPDRPDFAIRVNGRESIAGSHRTGFTDGDVAIGMCGLNPHNTEPPAVPGNQLKHRRHPERNWHLSAAGPKRYGLTLKPRVPRARRGGFARAVRSPTLMPPFSPLDGRS